MNYVFWTQAFYVDRCQTTVTRQTLGRDLRRLFNGFFGLNNTKFPADGPCCFIELMAFALLCESNTREAGENEDRASTTRTASAPT